MTELTSRRLPPAIAFLLKFLAKAEAKRRLKEAHKPFKCNDYLGYPPYHPREPESDS